MVSPYYPNQVPWTDKENWVSPENPGDLAEADHVNQLYAEVNAIGQDVGAHKSEIATNAHLAKNIGLQSVNFEANNVEDGMNELFTSVSNGKSLIAGAITDKGVPTLPSDTFQVMANNINQIPVGDYSIGDILPLSSIEYYPGCIWSFTEHTGTAYAVAVDNNGYVYSGSDDETVRKISPSGTQVWSFTGHTDWVHAVAVDNNGYVYSGSDDNTVRKIFDGVKIIA